MKITALIPRRSVGTALKLLLPALLIAAVAYRVKLAPVSVALHEAKPTLVLAEVMGTGTLEARVKTTISPRIQERLADVLVDQNAPVQTGQLLARLDDGELRRQVEVATASLSAARATAERVRADEARAQAVLSQVRLDHKRVSELVATHVTAQAELDKAAEQLAIAEADLNRSRATIEEAQRQVVTTEKTLAYHQERLSYAEIRSPYDGLIVRRDRDPGGVVVPGSSVLQLIATNQIWVSAWVDETAMAGLAPGQPVRIVFRSEPLKSYPGRVARLGREADRETREFLVDVQPVDLPQNWTLGQRAEVFIETGRKADALTVPQAFLRWREGKSGVFLNDHGRARWRPVTPGLRGGRTVEIAQGLAVGDQVVALARAKGRELNDGQRISFP
jgi:HlyD family secretion protein